jgi:phosphoglycerol transferase MdoB-like AlkP superfamily enzyme
VPQRYTIPMLWLGGAIQGPMVVDAIGNQTDIVATVLSQMGMDSKNFYFSNDLLNPERHQFAMFIYNQGFGMVTPLGNAVYNMDINKFSSAKGDTTGITYPSKALFQDIINNFNSL